MLANGVSLIAGCPFLSSQPAIIPTFHLSFNPDFEAIALPRFRGLNLFDGNLMED
jgi:hypothetical protein